MPGTVPADPCYRARILLLLMICAAVPLGAQEQGGDSGDTIRVYNIEEVVITGTRSAKKIIDVPYPIERVEDRNFFLTRKVAVDDALGEVPGLFMQSRYGNHDVRISIRGYGSRSNTGIRGVRMLLDGIPESEPDGQTRIEAIDFHSIGSIEVVRGNLSSVYTNAPGGVINFINDLGFERSSVVSFNQFGSYGLHSNGVRAGVASDPYRVFTSYNYHSARGFRPHSTDYWHIVNTAARVTTDDFSSLTIYGYYVDGIIRLPGSLTREQFDSDPYQANARDVARDAKRVTKKGRLGIRYESFFGGDRENEFELTLYGTIKYFERTARTYRIFNRDGLGASVRYTRRYGLFGTQHELSAGGDLFTQAGPIEEYDNIGGQKSDILLGLTDETIGNRGFFLQNISTITPDRLDILFTLRYDNVIFRAGDQLLAVQNSRREFNRATPKVALNYKITPAIAAYTSYGLGFDTPAGNEMDNYPTSSNPTALLNPDLRPQKSRNFEAGIKGTAGTPGSPVLGQVRFEGTFFNSAIEDEIVPFEVFGEVFFRNAARSDRTGIESGITAGLFRYFTLRLTYTWSDFSYASYSARSTELDSAGSVVSVDREYAGNRMPSYPEHNFMASLGFEKRIAAPATFFLKSSFRYVSGLYADDLNSEQTDGYRVAGITGGFDIRTGKFNLQVSGGCNNVFDRTYISFVNINSASGEFYEVGEPRNYFGGIDLGYTF